MAHPRTLLDMAGAPNVPASLGEAVLLIIDAQGEYREGALPLAGIDPAIEALAGLLDLARLSAAPVVHVAHKGRAGGLFDRDGPGGRFIDRVRPFGDEVVVEKALPNSFAGTNLAEVLEATGRKKLIVAGFMTHMCVSATVRAALDHGYASTIVSDAVATRDLPDPVSGGVISATDVNAAELAALADRFAVVARSSAISA